MSQPTEHEPYDILGDPSEDPYDPNELRQPYPNAVIINYDEPLEDTIVANASKAKFPQLERHAIEPGSGMDYAVAPGVSLADSIEIVPDSRENRAIAELSDTADEILANIGTKPEELRDEDGKLLGVEYAATVLLGEIPDRYATVEGLPAERPMALSITMPADEAGVVHDDGIRYFSLNTLEDDADVEPRRLSWAVNIDTSGETEPMYSAVEYTGLNENGEWGSPTLPTRERLMNITAQLLECTEVSDDELAEFDAGTHAEERAIGRVAMNEINHSDDWPDQRRAA